MLLRPNLQRLSPDIARASLDYSLTGFIFLFDVTKSKSWSILDLIWSSEKNTHQKESKNILTANFLRGVERERRWRGELWRSSRPNLSTSTCLTLALMSSWYNQDLMKFLSAFATRALHLVTEKTPSVSNLFAQFWANFLSEIFENSFLWNLIYC